MPKPTMINKRNTLISEVDRRAPATPLAPSLPFLDLWRLPRFAPSRSLRKQIDWVALKAKALVVVQFLNRLLRPSRTKSQTLLLFLCALLPLSGQAQSLSSEKLIKISTRKQNGVTTFVVQNLQHADVTVTIEMDAKNMKSSQPMPFTTTLAGLSSNAALTLGVADPNEDSSWSYTYYATWGSQSVQHHDDHVYALPYAVGETYKVSQGFNGTYSHTGGDQYAIDWNMPTGTPVHAARSGVVVGAKDDSASGGPDKRFEWDANYILIKHDDGTLGHYVHLMKGGNKFKLGDAVKVGDLIGLSGNTGHTTGPHLHFSVFKARDGRMRQTIPVKFQTNQGVTANLREGRTYRLN